MDWQWQMRHIADACTHSGDQFGDDRTAGGQEWCDDTWCGVCYAKAVLGEQRPENSKSQS